MANDAMRERMSELDARVSVLEKLVEVLQDRIVALGVQPRGTFRTMAEHSRCPACGQRKIFFADHVTDRDQGSGQKMSIGQTTWLSRPIAQFQIYACVACGFCEWYAPDLSESADELCKKNKGFRVIDATDAESTKAPYR